MDAPVPESDAQRARLARALLALQQMRERLDAAERARSEPIAVIGIGCRYPGGVHDTDSFRELLRAGTDAIREVPSDRWDAGAYHATDPAAPGKMVTRCGGFLDGIDGFDPHFFGIAPREAASLDPQQRLLLEVAWETLEAACIPADRLRGSRAGVFVGISSNEYAHLLMAGGPTSIDPYMGSGNAHSVAAGRLSFVFGFEGPSLAIDTACSSSLVAVHLACQSLRLGECDLALAGGVNVILTPLVSINHSHARMLAPDGRCKAFDAAADGFVRSEGCGLVALKPLSRACADGDPILAVIRGSAVNQDGHTSGLTVPSGRSQQLVIRQALAQAGVAPPEVGYVEAHGTGTALGDPIELEALAGVFGNRGASGRPLAVGSVKTNIGHAEAAAGIAGLIKTIIAVGSGTIPANLHFRTPNPRIAWNPAQIVVPGAEVPWLAGPHPRIAGVSSFGFGGTNAHVVVAGPPAFEPRLAAATERPRHILALSAQSEAALSALATRYAGHLTRHPGEDIGDLCWTANAGRAALQHRLCAVAGSTAALRSRLEDFAANAGASGLARGRARPGRRPVVAFLFTGQGAQYIGMARGLFETQPDFRRDLLRCAELLEPHLDRPLIELLFAEPDDGRLDQTGYTQPALFAVEYCLGKLLLTWGIRPDVMMGHSLGEYVAACLAEVFSLEDGIRLVAERARLMAALPGDGAMAAVFADEAAVRRELDDFPSAGPSSAVSVAAVNGPRHVVVAGPRDALDAALRRFAASGVETRALKVSQAFHSALVEPMLAAFERVAGSIALAPPRITLVSNLTGARESEALTRPDYWRRHAREPVRFLDGMRTLEREGVDVFLEIGPHPVLIGMGQGCADRPSAAWLPTLRRGRDDWGVLLNTVGTLFVRGVPIDWRAFDAPYLRRHVAAPTYPFQRRRYWAASVAPEPASPRPPYPLLGTRCEPPPRPGEVLFETVIEAPREGVLADHRFLGEALLPASGYIEIAYAAAATMFGAQRVAIDDLVFHRPLAFGDAAPRQVRTVLRPMPSGDHAFDVRSRLAGDEDAAGTLHATGALARDREAERPGRRDIDLLRQRMSETVTPERLYAGYAKHGISFGPSLRACTQLQRGPGEALGRIRLPDAAAAETGYWLHPTWLDGCAQVLGAAMPESDTASLQARIRSVRVHRRPQADAAWVHAVVLAADPRGVRTADLFLLDDDGEVLVEMLGLEACPANAALPHAVAPALYTLQWVAQPTESSSGHDLPQPASLAAGLQKLLAAGMADRGLLDYADALARLDALAPRYIAAALRQLGWHYRPGDGFTAEAACRSLGIVLQHARLFDRLLEILAADGMVRRAGPAWLAEASLPPPDTDQTVGPDAAATEFLLLDRCGSRLADVLTGDCDPLALLFADGDRGAAAVVYQESPGAAAMHGLLRSAVARIGEGWPGGRPLRILEVGAGTGGATSHVLDALPPDSDYVFTDVSRGFLAQARARFAGHGFVRYETLDLELPPERQGFAGRRFDVVIAFNVLHATRSISDTIAHVRQMLAPGGLLLALENVAPAPWVDLIWGLTPGWWRFADHDLRPSSPLLTGAQWRGVLARNGFAAAEIVAADAGQHPVMARQALLLARNAPPEGEKRNWLILADAGGVGDAVAALLEARGDHAICVTRKAAFAGPEVQAGFARLFPATGTVPERILHLWGLDAADPAALDGVSLAADAEGLASGAVALLQTLIAAGLKTAPSLWLVTRGLQAIGDATSSPKLSAAPLCGIGKVIAREHPQFWGGLLDLDVVARADDADRIIEAVLGAGTEDHLALRGAERFVARVVPLRPTTDLAVKVHGDAGYLVTGGCGALGLATAEWLVAHGARHLVLVGRGGAATPAAREAIAALERAGASLQVCRAHVADERAMRQVIAAMDRPLRGIVHAAGLPGRRSLAEVDVAALDEMFGAKVAGTWTLHRLTRDIPLDFFVCCSSMVSLWGAKEQGHYVAANHFLDAFAQYRRASGLPALTINWGPLSGGGMLPEAEIPELRRIGVTATPLGQIGDTLERLLGSTAVQAAAARIDWTLFRDVYQARGPCRMFDLVADRGAGRAVRATPPEPASIRDRLQQAPAGDRRDLLIAHLQATLAQVLALEPGHMVDRQQGLFEMGMDSLTAMELRSRLEGSLAMTLPSTLAFDYGTVDALADFLLRDPEEPAPPSRMSKPSLAPDTVRAEAARARVARMSEREVADLLAQRLLPPVAT